MPDLKEVFYRIAWQIPGYGKGHGDWHTEEESKRILEPAVEDCNREYGAGTHIIETNDGEDARRETEALIKRISTKKTKEFV